MVNCPNCGSSTRELRECDKCGKIGCHKCLKKTRDEWFCLDCKKSEDGQTKEPSDIFSLFG